MALALTIFTIITGTASLLGILHIFIAKREQFKRTTAALFFIAFAWSLYVLVVPTSTVRNVAEKFTLFKAPTVEEPSKNLMIQRGAIELSGFEPLAVEFAFPYKEIPQVEVVNVNGYSEDYVPRVLKVTPHQVVFRSSMSGPSGLFLTTTKRYNWVARGTPLEPLTQQ